MKLPQSGSAFLRCSYCNSTWFEAKKIMICQFYLNHDGTIGHMAEKPPNLDKLPSYYRCARCGRFNCEMVGTDD